jgi:hypothetical protein
MAVPVRYLFLFLLLVILGVGGFWWFGRAETRGYPEPMPVEAFLERPLQFAGNRYHLEASVVNLLSSRQDLGRIVLVAAGGGGERLPLFLPAELETNLQFQQQYLFLLTVEDGGLLYVRELKKI